MKKLIKDQKREILLRNEFASMYDAITEKHKYKYFSFVKIKSTLEKLKPLPDDVILDIGSSTGKLTAEYALKCRLVIATDFSFDSLLLLRQRFQSQNITNYHIVQLDACFLPFKDNSLDKVLNSAVFHHIPSAQLREQSLQEIKRTLKPHGKLVISVYNYNIFKKISKILPDRLKLHSDVEKESYHSDGIYYYNFSAKEIIVLLKRYFIVEECYGIINRIPWLTSKSGKYGMYIDRFLEKKFLSIWLGHLLLASLRRQ